MDVYLKYACAIVAFQNSLKRPDEITEEMIDVEIDNSLNKLYLHTKDDAKVCTTGKFRFASKDMLPDFLENYNKVKSSMKIAVHLPIPDLDKKKFLTEIVNNFDSLFDSKKNLKESNFILFNSQSYLSRNCPNGYKLPTWERKLYFLAHITPYKASYKVKEGDAQNKYAIYVDLEFPLLIKYVQIFIEHWKEFNQDIFEVNVNKTSKGFYEPQKINYSVKGKFHSGVQAPLLKFQVLKFITQIRVTAKLDDEDELYERLADATLYELNVKKKTAEQFNLNNHLIGFAIDDKISDFIETIFSSFYHTYKDIKSGNPKSYEKKMSELVYGVLNIFKSPKNKNNINYVNQFRIKYINHNVNYKNYIDIMETILKLSNSKELIDAIKEIGQTIKSAMWSHTYKWATENKKSDQQRNEHYDDVCRDMQFTISAMNDLTSFLKLSTNIQRRLGRTVSTEKLFPILISEPEVLKDVRNLLNFYLAQPSEKKEVKEPKVEEEFELLD